MDIPQSFVSRFSENPNQPEKILESMDDQEADEVADWYLEVMAKIVQDHLETADYPLSLRQCFEKYPDLPLQVKIATIANYLATSDEPEREAFEQKVNGFMHRLVCKQNGDDE